MKTIILLILVIVFPVTGYAYRAPKPQRITDFNQNGLVILNETLEHIWDVTNGRYNANVETTVPSGSATEGDFRFSTYGDIDRLYIYIGGSWKYIDIHNDDKRLSIRPQLYAGRIGGIVKPTFVSYGAFAGYSFPIYNSDNEEMYFREFIPGRWNGSSNITVHFLVALASAETAGEEFRFQFSWSNNACSSGVLSSSTTDVEVEQELADSRAAQYSVYCLDFDIDYDAVTPNLSPEDLFAGRIRRVSVEGGGDEVDGEVILMDCVITYTVDKIFKTS